MSEKTWKIAAAADLEPTLAFFETVKDMTDPPFTTYPHGLKGTLEILLAEGRLLVAEIEQNDADDHIDADAQAEIAGPAAASSTGRIVGLLGYFHGTPRLRSDGGFNFEDPEVAYVYCFVVGPAWRNPWSYLAVPFLAKCLLADGHTEARFRTYRDNNDLVNRLYRKHGYFIREETNLQGAKSNLYGADVRTWADRFGFYKTTGA